MGTPSFGEPTGTPSFRQSHRDGAKRNTGVQAEPPGIARFRSTLQRHGRRSKSVTGRKKREAGIPDTCHCSVDCEQPRFGRVVMARLARAEVFDPGEVSVFHCINRCARRCFLCGHDPLTGNNFYRLFQRVASRPSSIARQRTRHG